MHHNTKLIVNKGERFGSLVATDNKCVVGEGCRGRRYLREFIQFSKASEDTQLLSINYSCFCLQKQIVMIIIENHL